MKLLLQTKIATLATEADSWRIRFIISEEITSVEAGKVNKTRVRAAEAAKSVSFKPVECFGRRP